MIPNKTQIKAILSGKVNDLIAKKKREMRIESRPFCWVVESISPTVLHYRTKGKKAYFVNVRSGKTLLLKSGLSHTHAILIDATKKSRKFKVKRKIIVPLVLKLGYESLVDYIADKENSEYNADILELAGRMGWVRVTEGNKGHYDFQGMTFEEIAVAMKKISETAYIKSAIVEEYGGNHYSLRNIREVNYFMDNKGKYKRIELADFR